MDMSDQSVEVHLRTDANNLVTTDSSTHLPEQRETIHMIQMLRKEACSGQIDDFAHIRTLLCLSDSLTKQSAKSDELRKAVISGTLKEIDLHPAFRMLMQHKAFLSQWLDIHLPVCGRHSSFLGVNLYES